MKQTNLFNAGTVLAALGASYIILFFSNIYWQKSAHLEMVGFPFVGIPVWAQIITAIMFVIVGALIAVSNRNKLGEGYGC